MNEDEDWGHRWGEHPYDHKTMAEIIHDYVVIRGDLSEQYARDQLADIIERHATHRATIAGKRAYRGDAAEVSSEERYLRTLERMNPSPAVQKAIDDIRAERMIGDESA